MYTCIISNTQTPTRNCEVKLDEKRGYEFIIRLFISLLIRDRVCFGYYTIHKSAPAALPRSFPQIPASEHLHLVIS